jgi:hypothetical protein
MRGQTVSNTVCYVTPLRDERLTTMADGEQRGLVDLLRVVGSVQIGQTLI